MLFFLFITFFGFAQEPFYPDKTNRYINDFANVIPDDKEEELNDICKNIEKQCSAQVVVITTNNVEKEYPIELYSIQLAKKWGIGQKGIDNGLLILICPNNRKSRIEVGYGLEGILTDVLTKRIQDQNFKPNFRKGDFYTGIKQVLISIKSEIDPEAIRQKKAYEEQKEKEASRMWSNLLNDFLLYTLYGIIFIILYSLIKKQIKKQKEIKLEKERKEKEIEHKKLEAELAEKELISRAKKLESQITLKFENIKSTLIDMGDFLNSKEVLKNLEELFLTIRKEIENAKYIEYDFIISTGTSKIDNLTYDILNKFQSKKNFEYFIKNDIENFKIYKNDFEKTIEETKYNYRNYDQSIWEKGFQITDCSIDKFLFTYSVLETIKNELLEDIKKSNFDLVNKKIKTAQDQISIIKTFKEALDVINNKIIESEKFIEKSQDKFEKILSSIDYVYSNQYVKLHTIKEWKNKRKEIIMDHHFLLFNIPVNYNNPIAEKNRIENFFISLEKYKKPALLDMEVETENIRRKKEEDLRKKRQEEEEEERRRNSYRSSSNDFGSSSSDSGGSSFGGGDFGGGGSSSDW